MPLWGNVARRLDVRVKSPEWIGACAGESGGSYKEQRPIDTPVRASWKKSHREALHLKQRIQELCEGLGLVTATGGGGAAVAQWSRYRIMAGMS
ncbi:hypothetical protein TNCV_2264941 [Trichonephila clavipes]|nr:hypothetical protein TNCV_2264941 [Trichonephila clavipes]